jgi:uncharacterized protein (TIGR03435 family)
MRVVVLLGVALLMQAQSRPEELLARVRARVAETLGGLSRFMCTQTVDRAEYRVDPGDDATPCGAPGAADADAAHLVTTDRLRLDVGIGTNREMYSWVGENHFHDRNLTQLVKAGAISNGSFASFLTAIFQSDRAEFTSHGETVGEGRRLAAFAYEVLPADSHYVFMGRIRVTTGYEGSFLVDPATADLVQLVVRTKDLPRETGSCQATTTLEYHRVHWNDAEFLLPASTWLQILDINGDKKDNRTVFSDCHEFLGESTVTFGTAADTTPARAAATEAAPLGLPDGLQFAVALTQNIDTATAAGGDPIRAKLTTAIRDRSSKILVPANTPVTARIVEIRRFYQRMPAVSLHLRLESVTLGGQARPFGVRLFPLVERAQPIPQGGRLMMPVSNGESPLDLAALVFPDAEHNLVIQSGLHWNWVTGAGLEAGPMEDVGEAPAPVKTGTSATVKAAPSANFEKVTMRPASGTGPRSIPDRPSAADPGLYFCQSATLLDLIGVAYDVGWFQIASRTPLDRDHFDVSARVPEGATEEEFRGILKNFLAQRFHLKLHTERREVRVYELAAAKTGLKLNGATAPTGDSLPAGRPGPVADAVTDIGDGERLDVAVLRSAGAELIRMEAEETTMASLVRSLRRLEHLPIVDGSGLAGGYNFKLEYQMVRKPSAIRREVAPGQMAPDLFTALRRQLGLELTEKKVQLDVLTVDAVDEAAGKN